VVVGVFKPQKIKYKVVGDEDKGVEECQTSGTTK
jgi:hypothetical protein